MGMSIRNSVFALIACLSAAAQSGGELRFCLRSDPKTFDPLLAAEDASETIRYLTGGVLIRFNRQSQRAEPELASSWRIRDGGKRIDFVLRPGIRFSDGVPFRAADVVATVRRLADPNLHSAIADTFRTAGGGVQAQLNGTDGASVLFSNPVAGLELLFDQLAITPARQVKPEASVLGPFFVAEHRGGQYVLLRRNPHYWKTDAAGQRLPYLDAIRLDIQANRETELLRFRRRALDLVDKLDPEAFLRLQKELPSSVLNAGPSLDVDFLWFNQKPDAPIETFRKQWFQSRQFRRAISAAIHRDDIVRLVYHGLAHPAVGPVSRANALWFNAKLSAQKADPDRALKLLEGDGFRLDGGTLRDRAGNAVEFSLITNADSKTRGRMGAIMQQDLARIGIRLSFTPIEFQSLIERITRSHQYEACLLGLTNVEIDPNAQMNVWMSSGTHHAWNPGQARPATAWEAEVDRLMKLQHAQIDMKLRKNAFDQVQAIIAEQAPIVYLVHPDVLVAVSPRVRNEAPSPLPPHLFWNVEHLSVAAAERRKN